MKILIVDDEALVRVALKTMINWDENGFEFVGEAENGEQALTILKEKPVDLVISDIKMPVMDGLGLIRALKAEHPQTRALVLSSYDDYTLVREALKLGALDYILKLDVDTEELNALLTTIREQITPEAPADGQGRRILHRTKLLWDILNRMYADEADMLRQMREQEIRLDAEELYCILIKVNEFYRFENAMQEETEKLNHAIINMCEELLSDWLVCYTLRERPGEFIMLSCAKGGGSVGEAQLQKAVENMSEMLKQYMNISVRVGIGVGAGITVGGLAGCHQAYQAALGALRRLCFEPDSRIIFQSKAQEMPPSEGQELGEHPLLGIKKQYSDALLSFGEENINRVFDTVEELFSEHLQGASPIGNFLIELFSMTYEFLNYYQLKHVLKESYYSYAHLAQIANEDAARECIHQLRSELLRHGQNVGGSLHPQVVYFVSDYLQEHYAEDISLVEIANRAGMNPSYLSGVLKKSTGKSYIEYLIEVRMEKAKELLAQTNLCIYEVGEKVGYDNAYYFNRIFKKVTGQTPGEYRKKTAQLRKG